MGPSIVWVTCKSPRREPINRVVVTKSHECLELKDLGHGIQALWLQIFDRAPCSGFNNNQNSVDHGLLLWLLKGGFKVSSVQWSGAVMVLTLRILKQQALWMGAPCGVDPSRAFSLDWGLLWPLKGLLGLFGCVGA